MRKFKYQEQFASALAQAWIAGKHEYVRTTIRNLRNKAQAAYIAANVALKIAAVEPDGDFFNFIHPNHGGNHERTDQRAACQATGV